MPQDKRSKYTETLLKLIQEQEISGKFPKDFSTQINTRLFWQDPKNQNSLRLTKQGHIILTKQLGFNFHKVDLAKGQFWSNQMLVDADKAFDVPYAVETRGREYNKIIIYDDITLVELTLRGGDLQTYLKSRLA